MSTTAGQTPVSDLGSVLMHEHLFVLSVGLYEHWPHLWDRAKAVDRAVATLEDARAHGVDTVCDLTTPNIGRDASLIKEAADRAGVKVIVSTGVHPLLPLPTDMKAAVGLASWGFSAEQVEEMFVHDIEVGIGDSGVRAGLIKVGTDPTMDKANEIMLRIASTTHRRTGVPISTHTLATTKVGLVQQDVFESEGVDLGRVVIGHCGDSTDVEYISAIIERGSYVGLDRFGYSNPAYSWIGVEERVDITCQLLERGYVQQLLLSHDGVCYKLLPEGTEYLTTSDLSVVARQVVPALLSRGVSQAEIDTMLIENPRRIFAEQEPY